MIPQALDNFLSALSIEIDAFAICTIASDAGIAIRRLDLVEVHFVLAGTLHLAVEGCEPMSLGPGSVIIVPPGLEQDMAASQSPVVRHSPTAICTRRADGLDVYAANGAQGEAVTVICGEIEADVSGLYGPFSGVTRPIAASLGEVPFVRNAFGMMLAEAAMPGIASRTLCAALMKACLVLVLRQHIAEHGADMLPGIFRRPWLSKAVSAILERPADPHTVASLASLAGRSRSSFAKEFTDELGVTPMDFVGQTRLMRASALLRQTALPVGVIAARVGFASRSHFSRAFRAAYAVDPSTWRRGTGNGSSSHPH
ncbi:AraC family transcriptional regulator [Nostoc sp. 3335mG]|nr:AraC family transcriptional regulator [Nostoc sp. 3335mG]